MHCSTGYRTRRRPKTNAREGERETTQAQVQGARGDAHPTTNTVSALSQALSSGMTMKQAIPKATSGTDVQNRPAERTHCFDGVFESGGNRQQRVMVFHPQITAFVRQEDCLDVVESDEHIKVGLAGIHHEALKTQFGPEKVEKAGRAWLYIMQLIHHMPIINQIVVAGSPSEAWNVSRRSMPLRLMRKMTSCPKHGTTSGRKMGNSRTSFPRGEMTKGSLSTHGAQFTDTRPTSTLSEACSSSLECKKGLCSPSQI